MSILLSWLPLKNSSFIACIWQINIIQTCYSLPRKCIMKIAFLCFGFRFTYFLLHLHRLTINRFDISHTLTNYLSSCLFRSSINVWCGLRYNGASLVSIDGDSFASSVAFTNVRTQWKTSQPNSIFSCCIYLDASARTHNLYLWDCYYCKAGLFSLCVLRK